MSPIALLSIYSITFLYLPNIMYFLEILFLYGIFYEWGGTLIVKIKNSTIKLKLYESLLFKFIFSFEKYI